MTTKTVATGEAGISLTPRQLAALALALVITCSGGNFAVNQLQRPGVQAAPVAQAASEDQPVTRREFDQFRKDQAEYWRLYRESLKEISDKLDQRPARR